MKRKMVVLGSTGSIGENALCVARALPDEIAVVGLAVRSNVRRAVEQAVEFGAKTIAVTDWASVEEAESLAKPYGIRVLRGIEALDEIAALPEADTVLCAVVGLAGLRPVLSAIDAGKDVALATKEVLVSAGSLVMKRRLEKGVKMLPVDSEHSALFQCLQSGKWEAACVRAKDVPESRFAESRIHRLVLTASGGPFRDRPEVDFSRVTPEEALAHPNWNMGPKVTIDSATMMNKGLEILEAQALFNVPVDKIDVLVHPQSAVHSLVTFVDGSQIAQIAEPDMRYPIQYALVWPERLAGGLPPPDLAKLRHLDFSLPDEKRFPCLALAKYANRLGGIAPAALNAADEMAVAAFLERRISFDQIPRTIEAVLEHLPKHTFDTFEDVFDADSWARREAQKVMETK